MAISLESSMMGNMGQTAAAQEPSRRAYAKRVHASEGERLLIEADYHYRVERDLDKARGALDRLVQLYPNNTAGLNFLGVLSGTVGDLNRAIEMYLAATRVKRSTRPIPPAGSTARG